MSDVIKVGIGDLKYAGGAETIQTAGLGSCVGVIIYDEKLKLCGLAHIMLPDSSMSRGAILQRGKYADTAISDVATYLLDKGSLKFRLKAKIAGGAQMF